MTGLVPKRIAMALGALGFAASSMAMVLPAAAQSGYGGYGGGYDGPRRSYDDGYDRRRGPRDDFGGPGRRGQDGPRGGGGPQARGSFVQSCRDIQQEGAYLSASCRMRGGGYRQSQIDTRTCRNIGNNNGRLVCE